MLPFVDLSASFDTITANIRTIEKKIYILLGERNDGVAYLESIGL